MQSLTSRIRRPVERQNAKDYLLLTLLSFAGSVALVRLFLELTGYPQLGNQTLHIAHLLWGGLLLFISTLLMLVYANRWVYRIGALLAGVGVGLFMDEVGKFITQSNDYFFPAAAPIIYVFFLLVVLLYMEVRRPNRREARTELYGVFDTLEEVLDRDLDQVERAELESRLHYVAEQVEQPDLSHLPGELLTFTQSESLTIVPRRPGWIERLSARARALEEHWLPRRRLKAILQGSLTALGIWAMRDLALWLLQMPQPTHLQGTLLDLINTGRLNSLTGLTWLTAETALKAACGLVLLIGVWLLTANREEQGLRFGYFGLLLTLTVVDLLRFYFNQFYTILPALVQFGILLVLIYYRKRYHLGLVKGQREEGKGESV
jgi:hypothetical protein